MLEVVRVSKEEWKLLSVNAHLAVFNEKWDPENERIDFALLCVNKPHHGKEELVSYLTAREWDRETLYWQYGGAFDKYRGTPYSYKSYVAFVEWTRGHYKRVTTYIENTNSKMLKFAASVGYRITGIRNFKGAVLLEHLLEFEGVEIGNG